MPTTQASVLVPVAAGDVIGSISGPTGRWRIIPEGYEEVFAGDHTVLLRIKREALLTARYLLAWLESETASALFVTRGSTIARLDIRQLKRMPVPAGGDIDAGADLQLAEVDEASLLLSAQLDSLQAARSGIFAGIEPADVGRRLAEVADVAATTVAGLRRHEDLLRRVQDLYPYPVARNVRALRLASSPRARYDEMLNSFESLLIYLTVVAAAWGRSLNITTNEMLQWRTRIRQGGASLGVWLGVARSLATAADQRNEDLDGFATAMSAEGRTSLSGALGSLLTERNKVHGDRPQSEHAYGQRFEEAVPMLKLALDAASFLVRGDLVWIDDIRPLETQSDPLFQVRTEVAMGDHPDWDVNERVLTKLVFEDRFYLLRESGEALPLAPFLLARRCSECQQRHVYHVDKLHRRSATLNSIDRGHRRTDDDVALVQALDVALAPE